MQSLNGLVRVIRSQCCDASREGVFFVASKNFKHFTFKNQLLVLFNRSQVCLKKKNTLCIFKKKSNHHVTVFHVNGVNNDVYEQLPRNSNINWLLDNFIKQLKFIVKDAVWLFLLKACLNVDFIKTLGFFLNEF